MQRYRVPISSDLQVSSAKNSIVVAATQTEAEATVVPLAELLKRQPPAAPAAAAQEPVKEIGGRKDGPEPTRYGDWEKNGRCIDF